MSAEAARAHWLRFNSFTVDLQTGELRKDDRLVKLQPQPFKVLVLLASRPCELVTREEIQKELWADDTFVDFEHGINYCIKQIRAALGDHAEKPRFIQTVPRRGYRFVASLESETVAPHEKKLVWRRLAAASVLALIVLVGAWAVWQLRSRPAEPVSPTRLAVLPFMVRGSEELEYLGEGIVDLLGTTLNTESQRVVDPKTLLRHVAREGELELDPEGGRRVAERFGAGRYVLGSVVESGGRLRIQATLYGALPGNAALARSSVEGKAEELFKLVDELTAALLVGENPGPGGHFPRVAAMTTDSLEALKAYLEGEKVMRAGSLDLEKAYHAFQRAVELDPTFALAWYRLAVVAGFNWETHPTYEYFEEALHRTDRMTERDRLRVHASYHFMHANPEEAESFYEELLGKYPDDAEAWALLSQVHMSYDWMRGRPYDESLRLGMEYSERAHALDPFNWDAVFMLANFRMSEGRYDEAEEQLRCLIGEGRPMLNIARAYLALGREDWPAWERLINDLENARGWGWPQHRLPIWNFIANLPDYPDRVREFVRARDLAESGSPEQRAGGHITLAIYEAARGRWSEASKDLSAAEPLYPAAAFEHAAILSLAPFLQVSREDLESIRDKVFHWNPEAEKRDSEFPYPPGLHRVLRPYLLGLLAARFGEEAPALQLVSVLEEVPAPELMPSMPSDLALSVRAHLAMSQGKPKEALALLEQAKMDVHPSQCWYHAPFLFTMYMHDRFVRAELLHQQGRHEEALGWYTPVFSYGGHPFAFAHLRMAEIRKDQGDINAAIEHYDLFTRFWKDCDPELRPIVEDAKARLTLLEGKGT